MFSGINLKAISYEIPQPPFTKIILKVTYLQLNWNLLEANELMLRRIEYIVTINRFLTRRNYIILRISTSNR